MGQAETNLKKEINKFKILYELATAMTSDQGLSANLNLVVVKSRSLLNTDTSFLALRNETLKEVYVYCQSGLRTEELKMLRLPFGRGLGGTIAETRKGLIIKDYKNDAAFPAHPAGIDEKLVSGLAVPLLIGDRNFGVLYAFNRKTTEFSENDLETLNLVGNIAAVEIGRSWLDEKHRTAEEKYRILMDAIPDPVIVFDQKGHVVYLNPAFSDKFGWELEEIFGKPLDFIPDENREESLKALERMRRGDTAITLNTRRITRDGKILEIRGSISQIKDRSGQIEGSIVLLRDVTDIKDKEKILRETNERLSLSVKEQERRTRELGTLNTMNELLQACYTEKDTYPVIASICKKLFPRASGFLGIKDEANDCFQVTVSWGDDSVAVKDFTTEACWALRRGRLHSVENITSDLLCSHPVSSECRCYLCLPITTASGIIGMLHVCFGDPSSDLSEESLKQYWPSRKMLVRTMVEHYSLSLGNLKLRQTLKNQSIRDPLTGLFNRRYLDESLKREMSRARRHGITTGIIMIDVDHFKILNDKHGHETGDVVLKGLASFLLRYTREEDILCRYGGEEFVLIMPDASMQNTRKRAEQICESIRKLLRIRHENNVHSITISLGVSTFPEHGNTMEIALNAADTALYQAKEQGRDQVVIAHKTF